MMTTTTQTHRIFSGADARQLDHDGKAAQPKGWYYEPVDYEGDVLYSVAYPSRDAAAVAAAITEHEVEIVASNARPGRGAEGAVDVDVELRAGEARVSGEVTLSPVEDRRSDRKLSAHGDDPRQWVQDRLIEALLPLPARELRQVLRDIESAAVDAAEAAAE